MSELHTLTVGERRYAQVLEMFEDFAIQIVKATTDGPLNGARVLDKEDGANEFFDIIVTGRRLRVACSLPRLSSNRGMITCYSFEPFTTKVDSVVAQIEYSKDGEVMTEGNVESMDTIEGAANILAGLLTPYLKRTSLPDAPDA